MTLVRGPVDTDARRCRSPRRAPRPRRTAARRAPTAPRARGRGGQPLQGRDGVPLVADRLAQDQALVEHGQRPLVVAQLQQRPPQGAQHAGGAMDAAERPVERQALLGRAPPPARGRPGRTRRLPRLPSNAAMASSSPTARTGPAPPRQRRRPRQVAVVEGDRAERAEREPDQVPVAGRPRQRPGSRSASARPARSRPCRWPARRRPRAPWPAARAGGRRCAPAPPPASAAPPAVAVVIPEPDQGAGHPQPGLRVVRRSPRPAPPAGWRARPPSAPNHASWSAPVNSGSARSASRA